MTKLNIEQIILQAVPSCDKALVKRLVPYIEKYVDQYSINKTDNRLAFFLGHCAIESAYFRTLREMGGLSYFEKTYGKKVGIPPKDVKKRKDLKYWYIGRGLIQVTWDYNYKKISDITGTDFVSSPWLLEDTDNAVKSAALYWSHNGLNDYADAEDYRGSTKRINGGYTHLKERTEYIKRFQKILAGDGVDGLPISKPLTKAELEVVQTKLKDAGYHEVGNADGSMGSRTVAALAAFKSDNGLPVNDDLDHDTLALLDNPPDRQIPDSRAEGTPPADDVSANSAKRTMQTGAAGVGLIGVPEIINAAKPLLDKTEETKGMIDRFTALYAPVKSTVMANPEIFIGAFFLIVFYFGFKAYRGIVKDYQKGAKF